MGVVMKTNAHEEGDGGESNGARKETILWAAHQERCAFVVNTQRHLWICSLWDLGHACLRG